MHISSNDLKTFYNSKTGRIVRRIISTHIQELWSENPKNQLMVGVGFALPYLSSFCDQGSQICALLPQGRGAMHWPGTGDNKVSICADNAFPLETETIDRVLVIHHLEHTYKIHETIGEIWRILKPGGRALFIVTNRNGFWARTDWSPFGNGTPFSLSQLCKILHENQFVSEEVEEALFMPPIRRKYIKRFASAFEAIGGTILPIAAGVHMVEVSKQLYAPIDKGGTLSRIKPSNFRITKPVSAFKG